MNLVTIEIDSNLDLLKFIDTELKNVFIHSFRPFKYIEWSKCTLEFDKINKLKNIEVREMQFDIRTDLDGLENILKLESNFIDIYQFNKPLANSLTIENLPLDNIEKILKTNGLIHHIEINFEKCFIKSYDNKFITNLLENDYVKNRIIYKSF